MITIIFTGIVYLLSTKSANKLEVILPSITEASGAYRSMVEPHVAYVKFAKSDLANEGAAFAAREPDFTYRDAGSGPETVLYILRGDELSLSADTALTPPFQVCHATVNDCTVDEGAMRFPYEHVAHRDKVCKECTLEPAYQKQSREIVAGRMVMTAGALYAHMTPNEKKVHWTFEAGKNKFEGDTQYELKNGLAQAAVLDVKSASAKVRLKLSPFAGNPAKEVTFELNTNAKVEIGNMPLAEALHLQSEFGHAETEDPHFALYYLMLDGPVRADPPIPHRPPKKKDDAAIHGGNCPPLADEN